MLKFIRALSVQSQSVKNDTARYTSTVRRQRRFALEPLEERQMLAVSWTDFQSIQTQYPDLGLDATSANFNTKYNIIEITAAQLSEANLRAAITQAGTTTVDDLIVLRTSTDTLNKITLSGTELGINIDATQWGSVTIVSLGEVKLTIDGNEQSRVLRIGEVSEVGIAGLVVTNGDSSRRIGISNSQGNGILNLGTLAVVSCTISNNTTFPGGGLATTYGGGIYNSGILTMFNSLISGNRAFHGGGIYNDNFSTLTVTNCEISANSATTVYGSLNNETYGGGIFNRGALTVTDCMVSENGSLYRGGGIYNEFDCVAIVSNSTISGNSTQTGGGGVYNNGTLTLTDCMVLDNRSQASYSGFFRDSSGGGIYNDSLGILTVINCEVSKNIVSSSSNTSSDPVYGGGIYNSGTLTVTLSSISANTTSSSSWSSNNGGGGIYNTGALSVSLSAISGNSANSGGGIYSVGDCLVTLTDCTISENTASANSSSGGGIYNGNDSVLTLTNCNITGNIISRSSPESLGGGICNAGTLMATNCTISGNSANNGGGIAGGGTLTNCTISENTARSGGGVYASGNLILTNCTISENTASSDGGGIVGSGGTLTVTNSTISVNSARNGGGVYTFGNSVLDSCVFSENTAENDGGGIYYIQNLGSFVAEMILTNCIISENVAKNNAGGIYIQNQWAFEAVMTVANCAVTENTANAGGGIYIHSFTGFFFLERLTLTNCTIAENSANTGGGIHIANGVITLYNTIVARNSNSEIYRNQPGTVQGNNNLTTFTGWANSPNNNIVYDPLKPLFANGDYRLIADSQAINKGDNVYVPEWLTHDLDGNPRIVGSAVDIGAYEYQKTTKPPVIGDYVVTTLTDVVNPNDGVLSLREALTLAKAGQVITFDAGLFVDGNAKTLTLSLGELTIATNVSIIGVTDNNGNNLLTIKGDGKNRVMSIAPKTGTIAVTLEDLTLTGGKHSSQGGALYAKNATLNLVNVAFVDNTANYGGALYMTNSVVTMTDCTMTGNIGKWGGAIYQTGGSLTISGGSFANNNGNWGGVIYLQAGQLTAGDNATFANNTGQWGGAIYQTGGNLDFDRVTFEKNTSTWGGGLCQTGGAAMITENTKFINNSASKNNGQAVAKSKGATLTIKKSIGPDLLFDAAMNSYLDDI